MDNLRSVLNIVLSKIPTSLIVNSEIQYDNINRDTFVKIAGYYLKYYSNDELVICLTILRMNMKIRQIM